MTNFTIERLQLLTGDAFDATRDRVYKRLLGAKISYAYITAGMRNNHPDQSPFFQLGEMKIGQPTDQSIQAALQSAEATARMGVPTIQMQSKTPKELRGIDRDQWGSAIWDQFVVAANCGSPRHNMWISLTVITALVDHYLYAIEQS